MNRHVSISCFTEIWVLFICVNDLYNVLNQFPISQSCSTLLKRDWRNWDLAREPNPLRVLTKRANDCWLASFASCTPPRSTAMKGKRVQSHIQLFALEPSLSEWISESIYRQLQCWCYGASAGLLSSAAASRLMAFSSATSPGRFSTFSEGAILKEQF